MSGSEITFRRITAARWQDGRMQRHSRVEIYRGGIAQPWLIAEATAGWNVRRRQAGSAQPMSYRTLEQAKEAVQRVVRHSPLPN